LTRRCCPKARRKIKLAEGAEEFSVNGCDI
jgi:hypothetical protein